MTDTMSSDFLVLLLVGGTRVSDSFRLNLTIYCVRKETTVQQMIYDGDTTKQNGHVVKKPRIFQCSRAYWVIHPAIQWRKSSAPVEAGDAPRHPEWFPWRPGRKTKEMGNHHEFPLLSSRKIRIEPRNLVILVTNLNEAWSKHWNFTWNQLKWRWPDGDLQNHHPMEVSNGGTPIFEFSSIEKDEIFHRNHQKKAGGISMEPPHETLWGFHGGKIPSQRKMSIYRWDFPSNLSARPQPFLPAGPATERRTRGVRNDVTLHELPEPNAGRELGELCLSQQPTQIYATCAMDNSPLKWMVYDDLPQIWGCHVSFFGCKSRQSSITNG